MITPQCDAGARGRQEVDLHVPAGPSDSVCPVPGKAPLWGSGGPVTLSRSLCGQFRPESRWSPPRPASLRAKSRPAGMTHHQSHPWRPSPTPSTKTAMASAVSTAATGASNGYPPSPWPGYRRRPSWADGRKIGRQLIELIQRAGHQRTPGPFIEFLTGQPARLEVLAQRCYHPIAVGIGGLHLREPVRVLRRVHRYLPVFCLAH